MNPTRLLPFACATGAALLIASELMVTFEVSEPVRGAICELGAGDRHFYALAVIGAFALVATFIAVAAGSKPAATAVAAMGVIALLIFLTIDLPDATAEGTVGESCTPIAGALPEADVVPRAGFWLELVGALSLALSGAALATLTPEQLRELRPRRRRPTRGDEDGRRDVGSAAAAAGGEEPPARPARLGDDARGDNTGRPAADPERPRPRRS